MKTIMIAIGTRENDYATLHKSAFEENLSYLLKFISKNIQSELSLVNNHSAVSKVNR